MSRDHSHSNLPAYSDVYNTRGIRLAERGWLDEAVKEFSKALTYDPSNTQAHENIANTYVEKGSFLEALFHYVKAVKLEPENNTSRFNLACFLANHATDLAKSQYLIVAEREWDFPDVHTHLGMTLVESGDLAQAAKCFREALKADSEDTTARHELARIFLEQGQYKDAAYELRRVLKEDPTNQNAYLDLGVCYLSRGFLDNAQQALEKAIELDSNDIAAHYHFALLHMKRQQPEQALTALSQAARLDKARVVKWLESERLFDSIRDLALNH